ncbi:hypothetical protein DFJ73DRAFT_963208 [Zopfochytrium polystomum]|nr:hypothetical protein DFJ73DRAFT_963208 [Zopfochytrium polystomum]
MAEARGGGGGGGWTATAASSSPQVDSPSGGSSFVQSSDPPGPTTSADVSAVPASATDPSNRPHVLQPAIVPLPAAEPTSSIATSRPINPSTPPDGAVTTDPVPGSGGGGLPEATSGSVALVGDGTAPSPSPLSSKPQQQVPLSPSPTESGDGGGGAVGNGGNPGQTAESGNPSSSTAVATRGPNGNGSGPVNPKETAPNSSQTTPPGRNLAAVYGSVIAVALIACLIVGVVIRRNQQRRFKRASPSFNLPSSSKYPEDDESWEESFDSGAKLRPELAMKTPSSGESSQRIAAKPYPQNSGVIGTNWGPQKDEADRLSWSTNSTTSSTSSASTIWWPFSIKQNLSRNSSRADLSTADSNSVRSMEANSASQKALMSPLSLLAQQPLRTDCISGPNSPNSVNQLNDPRRPSLAQLLPQASAESGTVSHHHHGGVSSVGLRQMWSPNSSSPRAQELQELGSPLNNSELPSLNSPIQDTPLGAQHESGRKSAVSIMTSSTDSFDDGDAVSIPEWAAEYCRDASRRSPMLKNQHLSIYSEYSADG